MSTIRIVLNSTSVGNGTSNDFTAQISQGIPCTGYEMAVEQITLSFSWFNISTALGNNIIGYQTASSGTKSITIPDGEYGISDINNVLKAGITANGDNPLNVTISANVNTLTSNITLVSGYKLDLTVGTLYVILGYNTGRLISTSGSSDVEANVTPVNTVLFHCSIVNGAIYNNGTVSDIVASYGPNVAPGSLITIQPNTPVYQKITPETIYAIRMYVTDNNGVSLNLQNQPVTYSLLLRPIVMNYKTDTLLSQMIDLLKKMVK